MRRWGLPKARVGLPTAGKPDRAVLGLSLCPASPFPYSSSLLKLWRQTLPSTLPVQSCKLERAARSRRQSREARKFDEPAQVLGS